MADVSGDAIATHVATDYAEMRIMEVLYDHLATELDSLFTRTNGVCSDGIYLPNVGKYYQHMPTEETLKDSANVVCYVGAVESAKFNGKDDTQIMNADATIGWVDEVEVPIGILIKFSVAPQDPVNHPVTGEPMRLEEIMRKRALRYTGAVKHTISKWAYGESGAAYTAAVKTIWPTEDFSDVEAFRIGSEREVQTWGTSYVQVDVIQFQAFPTHGN